MPPFCWIRDATADAGLGSRFRVLLCSPLLHKEAIYRYGKLYISTVASHRLHTLSPSIISSVSAASSQKPPISIAISPLPTASL